MQIISFFAKEFYLRLIYIFFFFLFFFFILLIKIKWFLLFLLSPLNKIKNINSFFFIDEINNEFNIYSSNEYIYLPIIEINLPFFTTSYIYIKYLFLFTIYILIPIIFYFFILWFSPLLKKKEKTMYNYITLYIFFSLLFNFIIHHYYIFPFFLSFIYSHYYEFSYQEFDIEFQVITYFNLYFKLLYINISIILLFFLVKKYKINYIIIFIVFIFVLPNDLFILLLYLNIIIIYNYYVSFLIYIFNEIKITNKKNLLST